VKRKFNFTWTLPLWKQNNSGSRTDEPGGRRVRRGDAHTLATSEI
jgi:hypothetical protein